MKASFNTCFQYLLENEGGFVDNPHDPGGATKYGVTLNAWAEYNNSQPTVSDIQALTPDDVRPFYETQYWRPLGCDGIPAGLDYCVFDFGVNSGVRRSAITLQVVAGTHLDGVVGPETLEAANTLDERDCIEQFQKQRLNFLNSLTNAPNFGKGWEARVNRVTEQSLAMIESHLVPPV